MVDIAIGRDFLNAVRCRRKIVESVLAIRICRRGPDKCTSLVSQINSRSDLKLVTRVEDVVLICIDERGPLQETAGKQIPRFQMFNPEPPL